ncbi:MAG: hypothetical protein ACRCW9_03850 [Cetobacterium sp.]
MSNKIKIEGLVQILEDGVVVREAKNMIMDSPFTDIMDMMRGTAFTVADYELEYCAVGNDDTIVTSSDTLLGNEIKRVLYTNRYRSGFQNIYEFVFLKADANDTLKEIGFFLNGSITIDTGKLWSRVLINPPYVKTSAKELTIRRVETWQK